MFVKYLQMISQMILKIKTDIKVSILKMSVKICLLSYKQNADIHTRQIFKKLPFIFVKIYTSYIHEIYIYTNNVEYMFTILYTIF